VPFAGIAFLRFTSAVSRWVCYLVGLTPLVAAGACQWTQLVFLAWVLLLSLVILFDCPLSRDSHPRTGSSAPTGPA
jgi:hypothetical protein